MKIQKSYKESRFGKLYLVPTPIGNLNDMTFRAIETLKSVAIIASEDTRNTQKLLNHFGIETKQTSLHEHNINQKKESLIEELLKGHSIAQVSDAGMPSISDPGHELVLAAIEKGISVISLPGATAGVTALIASGLPAQPFYFYGFLPRKSKEQQTVLQELMKIDGTIIFYESPHRVLKTLLNIKTVSPEDTNVVLSRELSKLHEEYVRGSIDEMVSYFEENQIKGECCLLVSWPSQKELREQFDPDLSVISHVKQLIEHDNKSSKDAIKEVAKLRGIKKQDVYKEYHSNENP